MARGGRRTCTAKRPWASSAPPSSSTARARSVRPGRKLAATGTSSRGSRRWERCSTRELFQHVVEMGHERVLVCLIPEVGLQAIIAVHSTVLGPGVGGVRMWPYGTTEEAITDVLRLSRGMTYKAAAAGLNLGGGKAG